MTHRGIGQLTHCLQEPLYAGLRYYPYPQPGVLHWAFACVEHRDLLSAPRELLDRDRDELARRQERARAVRALEQTYAPDPPMATGPEARAILARAIAAARKE